ncbi:MAG: hypothetical protein NT154_08765, partial [Verrucomicrobia bacterium]|nr:hypothetical protein [Verrucomicrobiota bacterium]
GFPAEGLIQRFYPTAARYLGARGQRVGRALARAAPALPHELDRIIAEVAGAEANWCAAMACGERAIVACSR